MNIKFWEKLQVKTERSCLKQIIRYVAEFFGTFILVFIGCMSCVQKNILTPRLGLEVAGGFGLAVLIAIQCFGHISSCHINPAISIAACIRGHLPLVEVPGYFLGQFLGGLCGYGILVLLIDDASLSRKGQFIQACAGNLSPNITEAEGAFIEFMLTFILATVACAVFDERNATKNDSVPIRFGFALMALVVAGVPFTGAHMNPARSLPPSLINGYWEHHWVLWVGPLTGGLLSGVLYTILFTD